MGYDKCCAIFDQSFKRILYGFFAFIIQALVASSKIMIGGFFKKTRAMLRRCFCPPDKLNATLSNVCRISIWERHNKIMSIGLFGRYDDFFFCCIGFSVADIF